MIGFWVMDLMKDVEKVKVKVRSKEKKVRDI